MNKDDKKRSLSNMLRERDGENKQSSKKTSEKEPSSFSINDQNEQAFRAVEKTYDEDKSSGVSWKKNLLIFVICIVLPVLSYYDYINLPFFGNSDTNASTEIVNDFEEGFTDGFNNENEALTNENLTISYNDYTQKLNSGELGKEFPGWEIDHLYESAVPISYLEGLQEADMINRLEFWEISTLVSNGVTIEYLSELERAGIFSSWEAWEIGNLHEDGVPASYLSEFSDGDVLQYFSAAEVAQLFVSGISAAQLSTISEDLNLNEVTVDEIVDWVGN